MTRDELRFDELTKRLHLWPDEVKEVMTLGEKLGKEVHIVTEPIEALAEDHSGRRS